MTSFGTWIYTALRGELVGRDGYGNRYYRCKGARNITGSIHPSASERRWVIYSGAPEGSKVPAEWHGWLHHTADEPPLETQNRRPWQKEHLPNMTGTTLAYHPPGSLLAGGQRAKATGDYEPWVPN